MDVEKTVACGINLNNRSILFIWHGNLRPDTHLFQLNKFKWLTRDRNRSSGFKHTCRNIFVRNCKQLNLMRNHFKWVEEYLTYFGRSFETVVQVNNPIENKYKSALGLWIASVRTCAVNVGQFNWDLWISSSFVNKDDGGRVEGKRTEKTMKNGLNMQSRQTRHASGCTRTPGNVK